MTLGIHYIQKAIPPMPEKTAHSPSISRRVRLLGSGKYSVMLTDAGTGYSHWRDLAITRWREDPTLDPWGSFILLRDAESGAFISPTLQPLGLAAATHTARFGDHSGQFETINDRLHCRLQVAVFDDAEVRQLTIVNTGNVDRVLDATSYAELILGPAAADASHPAFSKMFVQTQWVEQGSILLATRRRRTHDETIVWAAHGVRMTGDDCRNSIVEYASDRAQFLGRGRDLRRAVAMQPGAHLDNSSGSVLDPIFSQRRSARIAAGASVTLAFWTVVADSRDAVLERAQALNATADASPKASEASTRKHQHANDALLANRLLAPLLYSDAAWRAPPEHLAAGQGGAPVLWSKGISGDRPIILVTIDDVAHIARLGDLLDAQRQWRRQWFGVDVVVLNAADKDADALQKQLEQSKTLQGKRIEGDRDGAKAELFVLKASDVDQQLYFGLQAVARVVLDSGDAEWLPKSRQLIAKHLVKMRSAVAPDVRVAKAVALPDITPEFDNGIGAFSNKGRDYCITLHGTDCTPMPWANVIANAGFGTMLTAEGGGYTWSLNSQQNPLTPWPNDPVTDAPIEILYLRDQQSGAVWSAAPEPVRVPDVDYTITHGKGWTRCTHAAHGIALDLLQCVAVDDGIKLSRLRLHNTGAKVRQLSITGYVQWALGPNGSSTGPTVVTACDVDSGAMLACNAWRAEFGDRIAFFDMGGAQQSCSGDRAGLFAAHGSLQAPIIDASLDGRVGAGLDPCAALRTTITLKPGQSVDLNFSLGDAASRKEACDLLLRYRKIDMDSVLDAVANQWNNTLDTVQVHTPDRAFDILINDWLLYQTLGCRIWARSAYYQSSGAFGFRDQLQDVLALCVARPDITREHLLRSAARQFPEGDVQHWWLPPSGQGIRTRMTDDRLWLAYVAAHYIETTGDLAILDETTPFVEGAELKPGQNEAFFQPTISDQKANLYEHAARAIDVSLAVGAHELPLMGTGDWNDGMNRVGEKGKGESVWLAWFLLATIDAFTPHAKARNDAKRLARWKQCAVTVRAALKTAGWDGEWFRRGYYDDGTPLGSAQSDECKIDTIAQSWSVMSGAADQRQARQAMASVQKHLIRDDDRIAMLFTPPFDVTPLDPGYIKGYPPGLRENGGQYTHGAIWSIFAFAGLGQGDAAGHLFSLLNPIHHTGAGNIGQYRVEPYVVCADVYSVPPLNGRGGWTWYTGSAGWLYRAGLEAILGFKMRGEQLRIEPCIPRNWPSFRIEFRHRSSHYTIDVQNPAGLNGGIAALRIDGTKVAHGSKQNHAQFTLQDDGCAHTIEIVLG